MGELVKAVGKITGKDNVRVLGLKKTKLELRGLDRNKTGPQILEAVTGLLKSANRNRDLDLISIDAIRE
ncbi:hypothetical protein, partial [Staphylococcus aureus]